MRGKIGEGRQETGDRRQQARFENRDKRQETGDGRREARLETRVETRDGR